MDLKDIYDQLMAGIEDIDRKLDSLTDAKALGKRQAVDKMVEDTKPNWEGIVEQFINQLKEAPVEVRIGVYYGLTKGLNKAFSTSVGQELEAIVADLPQPTPLIQPEEAPELQKIRSDLYAKVKGTIELAVQFGQEEGMEMPRKRTGSTGKRGKRALTYFAWTINGKQYDDLKAVVAAYDQYDKVSELTAAMREAKIDTKTPGAKIEFTLPDGSILIGISSDPVATSPKVASNPLVPSDDIYDESEDDDDDDSDDDDE